MHIVFGMVDDKDIQGVMDLLPQDATYYFTKANNKRAVSENVLKLYAQGKGLEGGCGRHSRRHPAVHRNLGRNGLTGPEKPEKK